MDDFDAIAPWWRRKITIGIFAALTVLVWMVALRPHQIEWSPAISVQSDPAQEETDRSAWTMPGGIQVQPLAEYEVEARVLSREDYSDQGSFASPMDLALGWGPMSRQTVIDQLHITQSGRWYHYSWKVAPPIPLQDIITHSANTHIIPATSTVADRLDDIHAGDRVRLKGVLVVLNRQDGWHWRSSLTRNDSGDGACELMWVEKVEKLEKLDMAGVPVDGRGGRD